MNRVLTLLSLGAALAFASTSLLASGNADNGKTKAAACFACHGADGNGNDAVNPQPPRLAGQYNEYIQQALHEYKDGRRNNAIMKTQAADLSDQDIEDLAAYFSGLPTKLDTLQGHIQGD
jgi:cytochrome c553